MEKIINILMKRDGISFEEARRQCEDTVAEIHMAIASGDYMLAEELMMSDLGLEPDYIMDILQNEVDMEILALLLFILLFNRKR